jgi:trehalose 6-phosphate phosphatase
MTQLADADSIASRALALAAPGRALVVATDFDGTLAPIVSADRDAKPDPRALDALRALGACGALVCVASGRRLDDLRSRVTDAVGACLIAEHGAETLHRNGTLVRESVDPRLERALESLHESTVSRAADIPGARVERKRTSFALHSRTVAPDQRAAAHEALRELARRASDAGLRAIAGREVLEVRLPVSDKGAALEHLVSRIVPGAVVVYAGDDVTDDPALEYASRANGLAVFIASHERTRGPEIANLCTTDQPTWVLALVKIAEGFCGRNVHGPDAV